MTTKDDVLEAIRETAAKNGGVPLGQLRFKNEAGIAVHEWRGKFWLRWSEALAEAGFTPNTRHMAYDQDFLLTKLAELTREHKHFPTYPEMLFAKNKDEMFPGKEGFMRLGSKSKRTQLLREFANQKPEFSDILAYLPSSEFSEDTEERTIENSGGDEVEGFVYMIKSGRHYKIGRTTAVPRRHREITLELPEEPSRVHHIRTDDPEGIERYWHNRFAAFRANGEWFALTSREVRIFKRRRFM